MSIETKEIKRVFRYNGIELPDIPGMEPRGVRDVYSAQYPELVSAEIADDGIQDGVHTYIFRKAVGTKGADARMVALRASIEIEKQGQLADGNNKLIRALEKKSAKKQARAWGAFVQRDVADRPVARAIPTSSALAPVA
ncbi:MAG: PRTRC system protein C [Betaproteobacteria bacterium]|nr:PRTRC system protein C [Betaproteobacteria bacterium]